MRKVLVVKTARGYLSNLRFEKYESDFLKANWFRDRGEANRWAKMIGGEVIAVIIP